MKRTWLFLLFFPGCIFLFGIIWFYASIPKLQAEHFTSKITKPARVEWDSSHIPLIHADRIQDAHFIQGYLTARDRFFQMDLTRRKMAGRLAELMGPKALDSDIRARNWNYQGAAEKSYLQMDNLTQEPLSSFAAGVNEFLRTNPPPWEFRVLGSTPSAWDPADTFLVVLSMYDSLNRHAERDEAVYSLLRKKLSPSVVSFLTLDWGFLDSPILPSPLTFRTPLPPSIKEFQINGKQSFFEITTPDFEPGSNAWAVSGAYTESGKPILASDPHLDLRLPNLWYRLGIKTPNHYIYGATIPGVPGIVIGRNEHLAWAFTNSAVDNVDEIPLPKDSPVLTTREENILVKGNPPHKVHFKDSPWGPILYEEERSLIAVQWTALDPAQLKNLDLNSINFSQNTTELLRAFGKWAGPPQNAVFAVKSGDIGWTLAGNLPKRVGFDGKAQTPRSRSAFWDGYVPRNEFPVVLNPKDGFVVSANQRTVPPQGPFSKFGSHWPNSARAKRIQELLQAKSKWRAQDFVGIQTDNLSLTHLWYRDRLMKCPARVSNTEEAQWENSAIQLLKTWNGKTETSSAAYPLIKEFRIRLFSNLLGPIANTISPSNDNSLLKYISQDVLVSQLLTHEASHLLSPDYANYCDLLISTLSEAARSLASEPAQLEAVRWGDLNQSEIHHPFSKLIPKPLGFWLSLPSTPMGGDSLVPNVMTPKNGASMRVVIDLNDPSKSLFSQPGGQSSHPLSPHFSDGFHPWIEGKALPFEPQQATFQEYFFPTPPNG